MALNTHTQSLGLPLPTLFSFSFIPSSAYTQIKYLHFVLGQLDCLFVFSVRVLHLFKYPVALTAPYELCSFFRCLILLLSPFIFTAELLLAIFTYSHSIFLSSSPFFFFSLLWPSRWLVFVSLSLVAAAGSGLNNEITFTVEREAARSSTRDIITRHCSHKHTCRHTHTHRNTQKCVHTNPNNKIPGTCRQGCLK